MKEIIKFKRALAKIGWSTRGRYPNEWVINNLGERTLWRVLSDRIELESKGAFGEKASECGNAGAVSVYYKSNIELLSGTGNKPNCVSIGTNDVFVQFYNH